MASRASLLPGQGLARLALLAGLLAVLGGCQPGSEGGETAACEFTDTALRQVTGTAPIDGDTGVSPTTAIAVFFTHSMHPGATAAALSIVPAAPGTLTFAEYDRRLTLSPSAPLAPGTVYAVALNPGVVDGCGVPLAEAPYTFSFETAP